MHRIGKTVVVLFAAYGARFAFHEVHWIYKNRKRLVKEAEENNKIPTVPHWNLSK